MAYWQIRLLALEGIHEARFCRDACISTARRWQCDGDRAWTSFIWSQLPTRFTCMSTGHFHGLNCSDAADDCPACLAEYPDGRCFIVVEDLSSG